MLPADTLFHRETGAAAQQEPELAPADDLQPDDPHDRSRGRAHLAAAGGEPFPRRRPLRRRRRTPPEALAWPPVRRARSPGQLWVPPPWPWPRPSPRARPSGRRRSIKRPLRWGSPSRRPWTRRSGSTSSPPWTCWPPPAGRVTRPPRRNWTTPCPGWRRR